MNGIGQARSPGLARPSNIHERNASRKLAGLRLTVSAAGIHSGRADLYHTLRADPELRKPVRARWHGRLPLSARRQGKAHSRRGRRAPEIRQPICVADLPVVGRDDGRGPQMALRTAPPRQQRFSPRPRRASPLRALAAFAWSP